MQSKKVVTCQTGTCAYMLLQKNALNNEYEGSSASLMDSAVLLVHIPVWYLSPKGN